MAVFLLLGMASVIGFFIFQSKPGQLSLNFKNEEINPNIVLSSSQDSDSDGLKNWEEELWNTNPNEPDTDKDGAPDGQEIKENRDPTLPWPNDKITPDQKLEVKNQSIENIGQELLKDILGKKLSQGELDPEPMAQELTEKIMQIPDIVRDLSDDKLRITTSEKVGKEPGRQYLKQVARAVERRIPPMTKLPDEATLLQRYVLDEDKNSLKVFAQWENEYRTIRKDLQEIAVPADWTDKHREMVQILWRLEETTRLLSQSDKQPAAIMKLTQSGVITQKRAEFLFQKMVSQRNEIGLMSEEAGVYLFSFF